MSDSLPSSDKLSEAVVDYRAGLESETLDLPINREFISMPPRLTPEQYVVWCEERLRQPFEGLVATPKDALLPRPVFVF